VGHQPQHLPGLGIIRFGLQNGFISRLRSDQVTTSVMIEGGLHGRIGTGSLFRIIAVTKLLIAQDIIRLYLYEARICAISLARS